MVLSFLDHLENDRGNSIRTRNARLTAVRSFMRYASYYAPSALPLIQRVLAIPSKRFNKPILGYLSKIEMQAIIEAPDLETWSGRRDAAMLATFYNTGARVSEITRLRVRDATFGAGAYLAIQGKGRKQRSVPLWKSTCERIRRWVNENDAASDAPLFPNRSGVALSRSGVERRMRKAVEKASAQCPSLKGRRISPHTLRHTTAMHLLQSGVDLTVIALWLGHESPTTTHAYIEADLAMKRKALGHLQELPFQETWYRPSDTLLAFLDGL
jgi:site-specific recombinase XerD